MADIKRLLLKGLEQIHQYVVAARYKLDPSFQERMDEEEDPKNWLIVYINTKDFFRIVAVQGSIEEIIPDNSPLINGFIIKSGLSESHVNEIMSKYGERDAE